MDVRPNLLTLLVVSSRVIALLEEEKRVCAAYEPEVSVKIFISVFISYAHADRKLREKLEDHLSSLKYSGKITIWQDQEIPAGANWEDLISSHFNEADLILFLVSSSFIASKYCWNKEVQTALEWHRAGTVRVIPIILRPVLWRDTPLGQLQALPTGMKPVTQWDNEDAAFEDVARGIQDAVEDLRIKLLQEAQREEKARELASKIEANEAPKNAQRSHLNNLASSNSLKPLDENLRLQWAQWVFEISQELQPILKATIIFMVFILVNMFIMWLVDFTFVSIITSNSFLRWMYNGIKITWVIIVPVHYIAICIIEMYKKKATIMSRYFIKKKKKVSDI